MKSITAIENRMQYLQHRIEMLGIIHARELEKHINERNARYLKFLLEEIGIYRFALSQLSWVLTIECDTHNEVESLHENS